MIVSDIINAAARKASIIASGEAVTNSENSDILEALQVMLRSWAAEKINTFVSVSESFNLIANKYTYTIGEGGDFSTGRPNKIFNVEIIDNSNISYPVDIISETKYSNISTKLAVNRPYFVFLEYSYPLTKLYFYPIPDTAETVKFISLKPFTESGSFTNSSDTLQVPKQYEEAIIYNLTIRIAPEFGITLPRNIYIIAKESYDRLMILNSSNYVSSTEIDIPVGRNNSYNINTNR